MQGIAQRLHERIRKAVCARRSSVRTLARLLARLERDRLFEPLGYATVADYARAEHELHARKVRDLLRLGRRLPALPELDRALAAGELDWTKVRTMLPVLTANNETAWIQQSQVATVRQLEDEVASRNLGEMPPAPGEIKGRARRRLAMEMFSQELDLVRNTLALARALSGDPDARDADMLVLVCREYLAGLKRDEVGVQGEPYKIVLTRCVDCEVVDGVHDHADPAMADEAECHAELIDMVPGTGMGRLSRTIPPRVQRVALHRAGYRCSYPGCSNRLWLHLHHIRHRSEGGDNSAENLVCLCSVHHRIVHGGRLSVRRAADGTAVFSTPDGRVLTSTGVTHVGHAPTAPGAPATGPPPPY